MQKVLKYGEIEPNWRIQKPSNRKKTSGFSPRLGTKIYTTGGILRGGVPPLEAGFEGAQPLATFLNLCGFRVPGNDILALDEVQTVLYTPNQVFVCQQAWMSKFSQGQQFSGFSQLMTCPETLTHQLKRVLVWNSCTACCRNVHKKPDNRAL